MKGREAELSVRVGPPRARSLRNQPERGLCLTQLGRSPGKTPPELSARTDFPVLQLHYSQPRAPGPSARVLLCSWVPTHVLREAERPLGCLSCAMLLFETLLAQRIIGLIR